MQYAAYSFLLAACCFLLYFTNMNGADLILFFILLFGMYASVKTNKLTIVAALTGGLLSSLIYAGAGFTGIIMIAAFFVLGTVVTSWQIKKKEWLMIAEKNYGKREWTQVAANAGVAALLSLIAFWFPEHNMLWHLMIAASFSSATADTLSSELGNIYGKRFYNILTFRKDMRGLDGVISVEGTLFGIAGSVVIAIIYYFGFTQDAYLFFVVIIAGTIGNIFDSVLGAAFQRAEYLNNDAVNFLNTMMAAFAAALLF